MKTNEDALDLELSPFSPLFLCEQQGEKGRWKDLEPTENPRHVGCGTLSTTILTPKKTDDA